MEFSADNVEHAVQQFYSHGCLQMNAHEWLSAAQYSQAAWVFSWELLKPNKAVEVQYFGASCLQVKVSKFWHELSTEQYQQLKNNLLQKIAEFVSGSKIVLTRLCVVLSSMVLQMSPKYWPSAVQSLISLFQQDISYLDSTQRCHLLLEILTVLPEEFATATISHTNRITVRAELESAVPSVMSLLQSILCCDAPKRVQIQAMKCFGCWCDFTYNAEHIEPLAERMFAAMRDHELLESSSHALVNVFNHRDLHRFPNSVRKLIGYFDSLQILFDKLFSDRDLESIRLLCRVLVSAGENTTKSLVSLLLKREEDKELVTSFLHTVIKMAFPPGQFPVDETLSDVSFSFWYMLQDEVLECNTEELPVLRSILQPVYYTLIQVLLQKVQYPVDNEFECWTKEEQELFRCYRQDIGDTMMYCFNMVLEPVLGFFCTMLTSLIEASKTNTVRWQVVEGIFFMFSSMAECVSLEESVYLPVLMNLLPSFQFIHTTLLSTALHMIGSFGEWINGHPDVLKKVLPLVLQCLSDCKLGTAASMALKDLTRESGEHMHQFIPEILSVCQTIFHKNILAERDSLRLISCVGQLLALLPSTTIMEYLNSVLWPRLQHLQQLVQQEPSCMVHRKIIFEIQFLSWLFSTLYTNHNNGNEHPNLDQSSDTFELRPQFADPKGVKPVLVIMEKVLPIIIELNIKYNLDSIFIETVSEMFKKAIMSLMQEFMPLVSSVTALMMEMYQVLKHSSILDVAKQVVLLFGADPQLAHCVNSMLNVLCVSTLEAYPAILEVPDVVEAFMVFMANLLKKTRSILLSTSVNMESLLEAGIATMAVAEHSVVKASCLLVIEFLNAGHEERYIKDLVERHMPSIVDRVMRAVGGESARQMLDVLSDVLSTCCKFHLPALKSTLQACLLADDGYPFPRATPHDKRHFLAMLVSDRGNKRKMRDLVKEFSSLCRGMIGSEYAAVSNHFL